MTTAVAESVDVRAIIGETITYIYVYEEIISGRNPYSDDERLLVKVAIDKKAIPGRNTLEEKLVGLIGDNLSILEKELDWVTYPTEPQEKVIKEDDLQVEEGNKDTKRDKDSDTKVPTADQIYIPRDYRKVDRNISNLGPGHKRGYNMRWFTGLTVCAAGAAYGMSEAIDQEMLSAIPFYSGLVAGLVGAFSWGSLFDRRYTKKYSRKQSQARYLKAKDGLNEILSEYIKKNTH